MFDYQDSVRFLRVFIFGVGRVGEEFMSVLHEHAERLLVTKGIVLRVMAIANSRYMYIDKNGIDLNNWKALLYANGNPLNLDFLLSEAEDLYAEEGFDVSEFAVIDMTDTDDLADRYINFMETGFHVISANKSGATMDFESFVDIRQEAIDREVCWNYESNVVCGLPLISTVHDLSITDDEIFQIEGVLSGTLSYVLNNLSEEKSFSYLVAEAQKQGFTEPDLREDFSLRDMARKLLILIREIGYVKEFGEIQLHPWLPEELMEAKTHEEFLGNLEKFDNFFESLRQKAEKKHCVLRAMATFTRHTADVRVCEVDKDSPFFNLKETENLVIFTTERCFYTPIMMRGPGAGLKNTAMSVLSDLLKVVNL
jgi:aspartokinase/homoserine dehydrogenase 1